MTKYSNETLTALLKDIKEDVNKGFEGVHKRQDATNGNVLKNTAFRWKATGVIMVLTFIMGIISWEKISTYIR